MWVSSEKSPLCKCDGKKDIAGPMEASTPATTKVDTDFWSSIFYDFCSEKEIVIDLKTCTPKQFDDSLCKYYARLRKKTGDQHKLSFDLSARAALRRHVAENLERPECNLFRNAVFQRSNSVLDGVLKAKNASGDEPAVEHKSSISDCDMVKVDAYFEDDLENSDAVKLTHYCWFNLSLHFALRGAEFQAILRKDDINFWRGR